MTAGWQPARMLLFYQQMESELGHQSGAKTENPAGTDGCGALAIEQLSIIFGRNFKVFGFQKAL
jgi:hypothetical protein